jgi:hypothetical protein
MKAEAPGAAVSKPLPEASTTVDDMETKDVAAEMKPGRTINGKGEFPIGKESY